MPFNFSKVLLSHAAIWHLALKNQTYIQFQCVPNPTKKKHALPTNCPKKHISHTPHTGSLTHAVWDEKPSLRVQGTIAVSHLFQALVSSHIVFKCLQSLQNQERYLTMSVESECSPEEDKSLSFTNWSLYL